MEAEPNGYQPTDFAEAVLDLRRSKSVIYDASDSTADSSTDLVIGAAAEAAGVATVSPLEWCVH